MDRKFKIAMIAIWSFIGLMLTGLLVFCIINNGGFGYHFTFNEGLMTKVQKQEAISLNDCNRIVLDSSSADVIISSSDDNNLKVVESSSSNLNENEKFTFEKQGSTVLINDRHVHIMFSLFGNLKGYDKDLELESLSGDITVNDELKLNNLRFKESSGDISIDSLSGSGEISSSSGDININQR